MCYLLPLGPTVLDDDLSRYAASTYSLIEPKHTMSHSSDSHKRRTAGYIFIAAGLLVFASYTLLIISDGFDLTPFFLASISALLSIGLGSYLVGSSRGEGSEDQDSNTVATENAA